MTQQIISIDRILMAVDASMRSYEALEAAAEFASHLKAHLMALFVEDINLLRLAELPFAKELDRSSGMVRPLEAGSVTRALKVDAQKFERRLSEESVKRRITASMQVVQGHYTAAALEMAGEGDVVFQHDIKGLSYRSTQLKKKRSPRTGRLREPVWVFYDDSKQSERGLVLALSLCQGLGSDLKVVVPANQMDDALKSRLLESIQEFSIVSYQLLYGSDSGLLETTIQLSGGSFLVLPRTMGQAEKEKDLLINKLKCPRILV